MNISIWKGFGTMWLAKHVPEGRLDNRPALQRRLLTIPIGPVPEGRGEPSGLKMIRIISFAEKSDQASRFLLLNKTLRRFTPALRDGGSLFVFEYRRSSAGLFSERLSEAPSVSTHPLSTPRPLFQSCPC